MRKIYAAGELKIPYGITKIRPGAFSYCSENDFSVSIPNSVTNIGSGAFCFSALTSIMIPNTITKLDDSLFMNSKLKNIIIPNIVTSIGRSAFSMCSQLKDVYYTGSESEWNSISVEEYNDDLSNATIHYNFVPCTETEHNNYGEWKVIKNATCTEDGLRQRTCNYDDFVQEEPIPATGHTEKIINKKEASCTEDGYSGDKICSVCNEVIEVGYQIDKLGHDFSGNAEYCKHGCGTRNPDYVPPTVTTQPATTTTQPATQPTNTTTVTEPQPTQAPTVVTTNAQQSTTKAPAPTSSTTVAPVPTEPTTVTTTVVPTTTTQVEQTATAPQATAPNAVDTTQSTTKSATKTTKAKETVDKKQKKARVKKATPAKASLTITWAKVKGVKGYEIQLATDKKFKKNLKKVTIKKQKTTKTTVKKLKAKTKYYVRIRTYKTKKIKGKNTKVYSSWSKTKTVKTK